MSITIRSSEDRAELKKAVRYVQTARVSLTPEQFNAEVRMYATLWHEMLDHDGNPAPPTDEEIADMVTHLQPTPSRAPTAGHQAYRCIAVTVKGQRVEWVRFALSLEEAEQSFRRALGEEYPATAPLHWHTEVFPTDDLNNTRTVDDISRPAPRPTTESPVTQQQE